MCQKIHTGYETVCDGADFLGRKYVQLTEQLCRGNRLIAAIARVAINTLAALSLNLAITSICPIPFLASGLFLLGEMALKRWSNKPLYSSNGMTAQLFLESVTFSSPLIKMLSISRFSPISIVTHSIGALSTGFQFFLNSKEHLEAEMA
jgi:hypothetical protein